LKYLTILFLIAISNNVYSQSDTINGLIIFNGRAEIYEYCKFKKIKTKTYYEEIGETFHRTVLANGWFKIDERCPREIYTLPIVECKFDVTQIDSYVKYKRGKRYSGRINDKDANYSIIGFCKKGLLQGKVKILDNKKNIVWKGEMIHGVLKKT